ncbi:gas vesicle protein GvpJ [Streptomyces tsukubensis]|uniref:gas vesicle protein GvpJ n=1 Tax=Streptomyces tsukubensis TaxID=83656 RepID=UPI00351D3931
MGSSGGMSPYGQAQQGSSANLADILERVLDKGIVIAGDIQINLLDIELLTIKLRLLVASVDKAKEMGIDWWEHDPSLSSKAHGSSTQMPAARGGSNSDGRSAVEEENARLRAEIEALKSAQLSAGTGQAAPERVPEQVHEVTSVPAQGRAPAPDARRSEPSRNVEAPEPIELDDPALDDGRDDYRDDDRDGDDRDDDQDGDPADHEARADGGRATGRAASDRPRSPGRPVAKTGRTQRSAAKRKPDGAGESGGSGESGREVDEPDARRAPAKRAPAKRASAKRASAKKAPAKKAPEKAATRKTRPRPAAGSGEEEASEGRAQDRDAPRPESGPDGARNEE